MYIRGSESGVHVVCGFLKWLPFCRLSLSSTDQLQPPQRLPITWRSGLLGLFGVTLICGLTPYNDYALNNTFLVGNNLPIGVVMFSFLFVLLVNAPLHRWWPAHALTAGELSVALSMTLVSCTMPSSGLMR